MIVREKFNIHIAIFLASFSIIFSELIFVKILSGIRIGFSLASFFVYAGAILGLGLGNFIWLSSKRIEGNDDRVPWLRRLAAHVPSFMLFLLLFFVFVSLIVLQFVAIDHFFKLIMASMYLIYPVIVFVYCLFGYLTARIFTVAARRKRTALTWAFDMVGSAIGGILPVLLMGFADPLVLYLIPVVAALMLVLLLFKVNTGKLLTRLIVPVVLLAAAYIAIMPSIRSFDLLRSVYPREYEDVTVRTMDNFRSFFTGDYRIEYIGWSPYRKLNYLETDSSYNVTYDNIGTTALMKGNKTFRPARLFTYPEHSESSLIIGAGCGGQIPLLLSFSDSVTAVELDPMVVSFSRSHTDSEHFIHAPNVDYLSFEGLAYLKSHPGPYSMILFPLTDTFITSAAQSLVKAENYLYTTEGLQTSISSLSEDGCLVIALASAMNQYSTERFDESYPTVAVHLYRNLLELDVPRENYAIAVAEDYMFGGVILVYDNGGLDRERFDRLLDESTYVDMVITDNEDFIAFASGAETVTNDRPFFYIAGKTAPSPITITALFLALSAVIPISILFARARRRGGLKGLNRNFMSTVMLYAVSTGFGFMAMSTLLIQRIIPIFGTPYLAGTVVMASLLTGGGVISFLLGTRGIGWKGMTRLSAGAVLVILVTSFFSADTFSSLSQMALIPRILLTFALFLPVGTLLGGFFPKLLQIASERGEDHVILAYGTDVTFSIIGIVIALIIPVVFGYRFMFILAGIAYISVAVQLQKLRRLQN
ncbi:MAG: hypothetical protein KAR40_17800 [Candidatus Sabulitectum sp.]|nr:hypothetical protein [Candidatus Sabulitectum sp.]